MVWARTARLKWEDAKQMDAGSTRARHPPLSTEAGRIFAPRQVS